jgi:hypothetical protein
MVIGFIGAGLFSGWLFYFIEPALYGGKNYVFENNCG